MRKFFGRNLDYSGTEILVKLGSRFPDLNDPRHYTSWRDGMIIDISPIGLNSGWRVGYSTLLLQFPNVPYYGRTETNFKLSTPVINDFRKYTVATDNYGNYPWDYKVKNGYVKPARRRDYFIDILELLEKHYITLGEYEQIYDFSRKSGPIIISDGSFTHLLKHEDEFHRKSTENDQKHASIASGSYEIGAAAAYATWTAFEADFAAQLTGDLYGLGLDEETAITGYITYDVDCNGNTLHLVAKTGAEHNGGAYGNGARVAFGTNDCFANLDDGASGANLTDVIVEKIALNIAGGGNKGIQIDESGAGGEIKINRMLIAGDSNSVFGIEVYYYYNNVKLTNNIVYGVGDGGTDAGIHFSRFRSGQTVYCCNNTCIKNYNNFYQDDVYSLGTYTFKNNLAQGNTGGADYADDGGGFGTTAKNYGEDDSPDALIGNFHDGTSNFINYDANDYRIASGGDAIDTLKAGEDLTGTFTDDINGDTRTSAEFFIGADWIDTGGAPPSGAVRFGGLYGKALSGSLGGRGI